MAKYLKIVGFSMNEIVPNPNVVSDKVAIPINIVFF